MAKLGHLAQKPIYVLPTPGKSLVLPYGKVGIEIETERWNGRGLEHLPAGLWEAHQDHSLRNNGMEFTTVGGLIGQQIVTAVTSFCDWARDRRISEGYPRAGIHIHLDCTDMDVDKNEPSTMVAIYLLVEHALFGFAGEWRRYCGFCDALVDSSRNVNVLRKLAAGKVNDPAVFREEIRTMDRYTGLNLMALTKYGTVEYRHLATTFDEKKILDWINIIFQIKKAAQDWDVSRNFLKEVRKVGPLPLAAELMQGQWGLLQNFFDDAQGRTAINSICSVFGMRNTALPDWDNVSQEVNPLLAKKGEQKKPTIKSGVVKKRTTGAQEARRIVEAQDADRERMRARMIRDGNPFAQVRAQPDALRVDDAIQWVAEHLAPDDI